MEDIKVDAMDIRPVPHSFRMQRGPNGKMVKAPNPELEKYKNLVKHKGHLAMDGREPLTGDVAVGAIFYAKTPAGKRDGDRWSQRVEWNANSPAKNKAKKLDSDQPDIDNLVKSTLDSLQWNVLANDVQVRELLSVKCLYGPRPGVSIIVRPL